MLFILAQLIVNFYFCEYDKHKKCDSPRCYLLLLADLLICHLIEIRSNRHYGSPVGATETYNLFRNVP